MAESGSLRDAVLSLLKFDLDVNAARQIQAHQGVNGLRAGAEYVYQSLVCPQLEVLHGLFVNGGGALDAETVRL